MTVVKMHEAKTHLSRLVKDVQQGEEVVIASGKRRIARLVPFAEAKPERNAGYLKGRITIADDFDAPLPEDVLEAFGDR